VAPGRQLVREGPVTWLNSKNKDKVWMWLLTDVILIGTRVVRVVCVRRVPFRALL
jgi:hypothetical protein